LYRYKIDSNTTDKNCQLILENCLSELKENYKLQPQDQFKSFNNTYKSKINSFINGLMKGAFGSPFSKIPSLTDVSGQLEFIPLNLSYEIINYKGHIEDLSMYLLFETEQFIFIDTIFDNLLLSTYNNIEALRNNQKIGTFFIKNAPDVWIFNYQMIENLNA
jgi:hypothetical protein